MAELLGLQEDHIIKVRDHEATDFEHDGEVIKLKTKVVDNGDGTWSIVDASGSVVSTIPPEKCFAQSNSMVGSTPLVSGVWTKITEATIPCKGLYATNAMAQVSLGISSTVTLFQSGIRIYKNGATALLTPYNVMNPAAAPSGVGHAHNVGGIISFDAGDTIEIWAYGQSSGAALSVVNNTVKVSAWGV